MRRYQFLSVLVCDCAAGGDPLANTLHSEAVSILVSETERPLHHPHSHQQLSPATGNWQSSPLTTGRLHLRPAEPVQVTADVTPPVPPTPRLEDSENFSHYQVSVSESGQDHDEHTNPVLEQHRRLAAHTTHAAQVAQAQHGAQVAQAQQPPALLSETAPASLHHAPRPLARAPLPPVSVEVAAAQARTATNTAPAASGVAAPLVPPSDTTRVSHWC